MSKMSKPLPIFPLGEWVITAAADAAMSFEQWAGGFLRHAAGDWGDVCHEDKKANDEALIKGGRILSAYTTTKGVKFWIITEADRSVTTVLLPDDY